MFKLIDMQIQAFQKFIYHLLSTKYVWGNNIVFHSCKMIQICACADMVNKPIL